MFEGLLKTLKAMNFFKIAKYFFKQSFNYEIILIHYVQNGALGILGNVTIYGFGEKLWMPL